MSSNIAIARAWNILPRRLLPWPSFGTVLLDEAALQDLRDRPLVILSPHFDDACFSLGGLLARLGRGELVNIFTRGDYLGRRARTAAGRDYVYRIRDDEDAAFAARCGLTRHDLGCEEPSLRGRRPHQLDHVGEDVAQIAGPLRATLERLADEFPAGARGLLFAPLGVGRHVNHRATAQLVMAALTTLQARYDVYLYEDLPYARKSLDRLAALRRAGGYVRLGTRYALASDWAAKKKLLDLYPSQQSDRPAPWRYWPRALKPFAPHEAFWSVKPAGVSP